MTTEKRNLRMAIVLASFIVVTLISAVYAYIQKQEALRQFYRAEAILNLNLAIESSCNTVREENNKLKEEIFSFAKTANEQKLITEKATNDLLSQKKK